MEGTYDVMMGNAKMGTVTVRSQGLYCHFSCRCRLSGEVMLELVMTQDGKSHDLGLLMPVGGTFGMDTRIAAKKLGQGRPDFTLMPRKRHSCDSWIPLRPEEPFGYLQRLESAYLVRQSGQLGILLRPEK